MPRVLDPLDVNTWPKEMRYLYEERAGIKEFDGGIPRERAEVEARMEVWESGEGRD